MEGKLVFKIGVLTLILIFVIGFMYHFKTKDEALLKDRNQYISEYNKKICKYDIVEIQIRKKVTYTETADVSGRITTLKWVDGDWIGRGDIPLDLIQRSIDDFCNIRIRNEVNLNKLKAPIEWTEEIAFIFSDQSRVQASLSKKGIIKVGVRHYFTSDLLKLIQFSSSLTSY